MKCEQEDFHIKVEPECDLNYACGTYKFIVMSMVIQSRRLKANIDHRVSVTLEITKIVMKRVFAFNV